MAYYQPPGGQPSPWPEVAPASAEEPDDGSSEEEDDDDDEVIAPPPSASLRQRTSVSAEAYGAWNVRALFTPPVYPKLPEQVAELSQVLPQSFLFHALEQKDLQAVVLAMKGPMALQPGQRIIQEAEGGDHLYVIQDGTLDVFKNIEGQEVLVKTCFKGDLFGELALLYNCPRAASVQSRDHSSVWQLDRETFTNIVMGAVTRKRDLYSGMLRQVPIFATMPDGDLLNIIDTLKMQMFVQGDIVVRQGEEGRHFYIVYEGVCVATKVSDGEAPQTMTHQAGDYFGELALIQDQPRQATVSVASPEAKLLSMDRATFKRLMGPMEAYMQNQAERRYSGLDG